MAGRTRLSARAGARLAALLALVLLVHMLTLNWLSLHLDGSPLLRPLATPMFTRVLRPEPPAAVPAPPPKPVAAARTVRPQAASVARPASAPAPSEVPATPTAPEPPPQPVAAPAQAAASAAERSAPAPAAAAAEPSLPAASAASALDSWPADTRLNYRLAGRYLGSADLHGDARVRWQREGDRYQTRVDIVLTALTSLVMTSQGEVSAGGLLPRVYEELRSSGPRGARLGDDTITLASGRTVPRPQGVQDTASQFVELTHRFASGRDVLEVGRSVSFWMARPGAVDLWTYDIVGKETFQTPELGSFDAFHLKPRPIASPRGNITAEMWFAPSLQYLPVRIRVNMGDTYVDLMVTRIEQR